MDIAELLYKNYDKMDIEEMKNILFKVISEKKIKHELLNYEFKNYNTIPVDSLTLSEFTKEAIKIISRYHWKAGGFLIEDREWLINDHTSLTRNVHQNEIMFENTICVKDINDDNTREYLDTLVEKLSNIAKNISVELRFSISCEDNIYWTRIWCTDLSIEKKTTTDVEL